MRTLNVKRGMTADILNWGGARDNSGADYLLYNVYASDTYPVDVNDARNLICARYRGQSLNVPHKGRSLHYAVTVTDRYGNESQAMQSRGNDIRERRQIDFRQLIIGKSHRKYK